MIFSKYNLLVIGLIIVILTAPIGSGNNNVVLCVCTIISCATLINYRSVYACLSKSEVKFIYLYLIYLVWCLYVSCYSEYLGDSFRMLGIYLVYILIFIFFASMRLKSSHLIYYLKVALTAASFLLLLFSIGALFTQWLHVKLIIFKIFSNGYGVHGKIFKSTLNIYFILLAFILWPHNKSSYVRNAVIAVNLLSGILSVNRFFILVICFFIAIFFTAKSKHSKFILYSILFFIVFLVLFFLAFYLSGIDLHITNRFAVYEYWIPRLLDYKYLGTGLGLKIQALVSISQHPIPVNLANMEPNVYVHAHNLFLDKAIQSGVFGGLLYLIIIVYLSRILWFRKTERLVLLMFVMAYVLKNLVDDQTGGVHELFFWFFTSLSYAISKCNLGSDLELRRD